MEPLDLICDITEYLHRKNLNGSMSVNDLLSYLGQEQDKIDHYRNEEEALQSTMYDSGDDFRWIKKNKID